MADKERRVVVDEPGISDETNRAITENVRAAVGGDTVRVPQGRPRSRTPRRRSRLIATVTANRLILIITFLTFLVVGAIVSLTVGSWWFLLLAVAVHAAATVLMAGGILQATSDVERPDPGTLERMEAEGVPDPEGTFNDIVEEFGGAQAARGTAEIVSPGHNERTTGAQDDPGRSAAEQRTALTPGSAPESSAGESSVIAALPWYVVGAVVVASIGMAIAVGGRMWVAPALMVPIGAGWIAIDRLIYAHGASASSDRAPGDQASAARRLAPIGAAIVALAVTVVAVVLVLTVI
jgi:hypothetical protein